jgi:two-component system OmpR family response regulator
VDQGERRRLRGPSRGPKRNGCPPSQRSGGVQVGSKTLQRILLADDEPDILEISRIALETVGGYEVAVCGSGSDFLKLLPEFKPDLVIIDALMPDMNGLEVLSQMRLAEAFRQTPAVFLTGLVLERDLRDLRASGAEAVITKPFDPMKLPQRIDEIWKSIDDQ